VRVNNATARSPSSPVCRVCKGSQRLPSLSRAMFCPRSPGTQRAIPAMDCVDESTSPRCRSRGHGLAWNSAISADTCNGSGFSLPSACPRGASSPLERPSSEWLHNSLFHGHSRNTASVFMPLSLQPRICDRHRLPCTRPSLKHPLACFSRVTLVKAPEWRLLGAIVVAALSSKAHSAHRQPSTAVVTSGLPQSLSSQSLTLTSSPACLTLTQEAW
jgi:hypothetical protein